MPGNEIETAEQSIAISDPGERNRREHVWGDRLTVGVANVAAWLFPLLMVAIVTQVIIRKFGFNQAWLDDAQWWMYGLAMLAGFGYAITTESHVRVDIFHQNYSPEKKAKTEIFALGWLLMPFLILMTDVMFHYAVASWTAGEGSDSANGLHRLYLLKMALPVLFALAIVAAGAAIYRHMMRLTTPALWKFIVAAFPAAAFLLERTVFYLLWWFVRLTQPNLNPRRISREPLLENTFTIGVATLFVVLVISYLLKKRSQEKA